MRLRCGVPATAFYALLQDGPKSPADILFVDSIDIMQKKIIDGSVINTDNVAILVLITRIGIAPIAPAKSSHFCRIGVR